MYAIVKIGGHQYKVEKDQKLYVNQLEAKAGDSVSFDNVLLVDNGGKVTLGAPTISGAAVKAKVLNHQKADKVIIFKKKRRKSYQKWNGHRQSISQIQIESINA